MTQPSIFGPVVDAYQVETWMRDHLRKWIPTYLRELEDQRGLTHGLIPPPNSYIISDDNEKDATDPLPAVVIISPGMNSGRKPRKEGDGNVTMWYTIGVGVFVSANSREATHILLRRYIAALLLLVMQKPSLGGYTNGVELLDLDLTDADYETEESMAVGYLMFAVEVVGALNVRGGPRTPDPDPITQPGSVWPEVTEVHINVSLEGREEQ